LPNGFIHHTCPSSRKDAAPPHSLGYTPSHHEAVKRGIRPVRRTLNQSVLHRVVMEVIAMQVEIQFIPDLVFLIKPLPTVCSRCARGTEKIRKLPELPHERPP